MRLRLNDVARRAGVSEATVSRVVNDRPGVNLATRQHVQRIIEELGYETPGIAPRGATGLVGLIVPELDNPVFSMFAQTIETKLATYGYTTVVCSAVREALREQDYVEMLIDRGANGIIVVSGRNANTEADHDLYHSLTSRKKPLVLINGVVEGLDVPYVSCDDRYAVDLAVRHLAGLGHTRIGCALGPLRYFGTQRRLEGYESTMKDLGLFDAALIEHSVFSVEGGHVGARRLLPRGVTAVVASSDLMALGIIRAARESGLAVPADLSVVGYDDSAIMEFTDPPLTTVRQPVRAMSETSVRALVDLMQDATEHCHEYVFRPELVVRGSSAQAPASNASVSR